MLKSNLIEIRDCKPYDTNFIYASWLRGLYHGDTWFGEIPKHIFMTNYHKVLELIIARPGIQIKVACLKEDPDVILGYAVIGNSSVLHWLFVKSAWRKIGIGKSLLPEKVTAVTHLTKLGRILMRKIPGYPVFDPFRV